MKKILSITVLLEVLLAGCGSKKEDLETLETMPQINATEKPLEQDFTDYVDVIITLPVETETETEPETEETTEEPTEPPTQPPTQAPKSTPSSGGGGGGNDGGGGGGSPSPQPQETEPAYQLSVTNLITPNGEEFDIRSASVNDLIQRGQLIAYDTFSNLQIPDAGFDFAGNGYGMEILSPEDMTDYQKSASKTKLYLQKKETAPQEPADSNELPADAVYVTLTEEEKALIQDLPEGGTWEDDVKFIISYNDSPHSDDTIALGMDEISVMRKLGRGTSFFGTTFTAYDYNDTTFLVSYFMDEKKVAESIYLLNRAEWGGNIE